MAVSDKTKAMLWGRAALRCSICRKELLIEAAPNVDVSLIGEICHIVARKSDGPRGNGQFTADGLDAYDNLLLLCQAHHKNIDDHPESYSVERLKQIKADHEAWVATELTRLQPWDCNLSQFTYLNIPRLAMLAAIHGYQINLALNQGQSLHSLGWELNNVMLAFSELLHEVQPLAKPLPNLSNPDIRLIGITFSFHDRFRTKNMPYPDRDRTYHNFLRGDLAHDPHIYKKFGDWKLVLFLDPRWVTTATAYCEFIPHAGHNVFAGLCTIKSINQDTKCIYATPLVLGLPKTEFDDWLWG